MKANRLSIKADQIGNAIARCIEKVVVASIGCPFLATVELGLREKLGMPPIRRRSGDDQWELLDGDWRLEVEYVRQVRDGLWGSREPVELPCVHEIAVGVVVGV